MPEHSQRFQPVLFSYKHSALGRDARAGTGGSGWYFHEDPQSSCSRSPSPCGQDAAVGPFHLPGTVIATARSTSCLSKTAEETNAHSEKLLQEPCAILPVGWEG